MAKNRFINYLSKISPLSTRLEQSLIERLEIEHYKPHQVLYAPGQVEDRLFFLETGFARNYYYTEDGNEHTVKFWAPKDILLSNQGYWGLPAHSYTEVLDESVLVSLKYSDLQWLLNEFPEVPRLIKAVITQYNHHENEKQRLFTLNAEKRFREMRKHHQVVFQKAPLKMIASYLNMSRETLSRMISKQ